MLSLLQIFLCAFLFSPDENGAIVKTLPKVECTSDLLNAEITHYLSQQDSSYNLCYWNLILEDDEFMPSTYRFAVMRMPDFIPYKGTAYCQYGNDIFVIQGAYERSLFRKAGGEKMKIRMIPGMRWTVRKPERKDKGIKTDKHISYLIIKFSEEKLYHKWSEYDPCR